MSRIDDVKKFARNAPHEYTAKITEPTIDSMIDAMIADFQKETGMDRSEVEESITKVELLGSGGSSVALRLAGGGSGHGPPWLPHKCHWKIIFCWPRPDGSEVCLEIEIPWPCPDTGSDIR